MAILATCPSPGTGGDRADRVGNLQFFELGIFGLTLTVSRNSEVQYARWRSVARVDVLRVPVTGRNCRAPFLQGLDARDLQRMPAVAGDGDHEVGGRPARGCAGVLVHYLLPPEVGLEDARRGLGAGFEACRLEFMNRSTLPAAAPVQSRVGCWAASPGYRFGLGTRCLRFGGQVDREAGFHDASAQEPGDLSLRQGGGSFLGFHRYLRQRPWGCHARRARFERPVTLGPNTSRMPGAPTASAIWKARACSPR